MNPACRTRVRRAPLLCALAVCFAATLPSSLAQDEPSAEAKVAAKIERMLKVARTGRATVRPQAAQRLVTYGAPAAERLLEECGEDDRTMSALGKDLVEVMGSFDDARLRARLWHAVDNLDFPWRPSAARGLGVRAQDSEKPAFRALLMDPLSAVRLAALEPVKGWPRKEFGQQVRSLLGDPDGRVRRAAALQLDVWGERDALWYLLEDLKRTDTFFQQDTGTRARFEAAGFLSKRLGDLAGYDPALPPADDANQVAWKRLALRVTELNEGREVVLPEIARAGSGVAGVSLGLELLSCRKGEYYVRLCDDDTLLLGTGNPLRLQLPEGTVRTLVAQTQVAASALGDERFWGEPGCDLEQFYWQPTGERLRTWQVAKGYGLAVGARPGALTTLYLSLLEALPNAASADERSSHLATRLRDALGAVGGDLSPR